MPVMRNKNYLCFLALSLSASAGAQNADDAIADCARISSTGDRILCLEEALRRSSPAEAKSEPVVAASQPPPAAVVTTAPATSVELGAEQVAELRGEKAQQIRSFANIVSHKLIGSGRLRLTLDNGQVWQQTGDDDDGIARKIRGEENIAVEMWQSRSGGYRMHLVQIDRTLKVRRIR